MIAIITDFRFIYFPMIIDTPYIFGKITLLVGANHVFTDPSSEKRLSFYTRNRSQIIAQRFVRTRISWRMEAVIRRSALM